MQDLTNLCRSSVCKTNYRYHHHFHQSRTCPKVNKFDSQGKAHCVKSVQIRSLFWFIFSCIPFEYRKIWTRIKLRIWTLYTQWLLKKTLVQSKYLCLLFQNNSIQFRKYFSIISKWFVDNKPLFLGNNSLKIFLKTNCKTQKCHIPP